MRGRFDQLVGHATHGRNHHHQVTFTRGVANDFHYFPDAGRIADTGPAKLHDSQRFVHIRHGETHRLLSVATAGLWDGALVTEALFTGAGETNGKVCFRWAREYQALCFRRLLTQS